MDIIKTILDKTKEKLELSDWKGLVWAMPAVLITGAVALSLFQGSWNAKTFSKDIIAQLKSVTSIIPTDAAEKDASTTGDAFEDKISTGSDFSEYEDGEYEGEGEGFAGTIGVTVTIASKKLENIEVTYVEADDQPFFNKAKGVIEKMMSSQTMDVDVVAGATYSSNGIIAAVKNALTGEVSKSQSTTSASPETPATVSKYASPENGYIDGTYEGVGTGFGGEIKVRVVIEGGKFTQINILSSPGEGSSYLAKSQSLIPMIISQQSTDIDAVSGATYTSNGILSAIQNALSKAVASSSTDSEDSKEEDYDEDDDSNTDSTSYKNGTYIGSATGYGGEIKVKVLVSKKKISSVSITSAKKETPSFLKRALTLTDTIVKKQSADVDVVAGATYTSNGIKNAVKNALANGPVTDDSSSDSDGSDDSDNGTNNNSGNDGSDDDSSTDTPGTTSGDAVVAKYKDGTFTGYGTGFMGKNSVKATVSISGGKITKINITSSDTEEYLQVALDIIGDLLSKQQTEGVDVISGATFSSEGILEAVSNALKGALNE